MSNAKGWIGLAAILIMKIQLLSGGTWSSKP